MERSDRGYGPFQIYLRWRPVLITHVGQNTCPRQTLSPLRLCLVLEGLISTCDMIRCLVLLLNVTAPTSLVTWWGKEEQGNFKV